MVLQHVHGRVTLATVGRGVGEALRGRREPRSEPPVFAPRTFTDVGAFCDAEDHPNARQSDDGNLEVEVTVDDPKAYTKPWTRIIKLTLVLDMDLLEYICNENEKTCKSSSTPAKRRTKWRGETSSICPA